MLAKRIKEFPIDVRKFLRIASNIADSWGMNIYLVGGIVRDLILRRESFDYDIVVEGDGIGLCEAISHKLGVSFQKHHTFGTATVYYKEYKIDFATCRREYYPWWGSLPKVSKASLKEDLFRRDFTINAMAISINKNNYGELIDFYNGYSDLKKGLIRVMHDSSFLDDPTRMLRAIRFEQRFAFKIERHTFNLLKEASLRNALKFIDEQRVRDELILILKEQCPLKYLRRIQTLIGFSFIDDNFNLKKRDYQLIKRVEKAIFSYNANFVRYRRLDAWLIYLMAILNKLSLDKVIVFCKKFRLHRGEEKRLIDSFKHKKIIKYLARRNIRKSKIFNTLVPLSFETIIFLYAYTANKYARENFSFFLKHLAGVKLKIKGGDLKALGFKPAHLYSKALNQLKSIKIEKGLTTKKEELKEIDKIFKRFKRAQKVL